MGLTPSPMRLGLVASNLDPALSVFLANSDLIDKLGVVCAVKGAGPQRDRPARELVRSTR